MADWSAIREPTASVTFDLSVISDGPKRGAASDAINADALRAFTWSLPPQTELVALDWQPSGLPVQTSDAGAHMGREWKIPVYPDGDYYAFLAEDLTAGTFGHPWERTLCIMATS